MSQCDLHFGDPTAHAIVEWVLSKLSFASNLTEVVSTLSEDFCKELNAERFINCLHQQVKKDRNLFAAIERIAKELDETEKWNHFPHLSVLLHSIAGESLKSQDSCSIAQEYQILQEKYQDLNPLRLELPILARSTEGWKIANRLVQNLENDKTKKKEIVKDIAKNFRILQWEVLVRNLIEENMRGRLCFHPITVDYDISGMPDLKEFLIDFISQARSVERHFTPSDGEIQTKLRSDYLLEGSFRHCYTSFQGLLPKVTELYPPVHEDYIRSFANMRTSDNSLPNMLIEDGEISFFSLLWLLRHAAEKGEKPKAWKLDPDEKLTVRFRPSDDKSPDDWWLACDMYELAEECGLIIPLSDLKCIPTRRWHSLIAWLRRLNHNLRNKFEDDKQHLQRARRDKKLCHDSPLLQRLPVKKLDYDREAELSFVEKLQKFLTSKDLLEMLDDLEVHVPMTCEAFAVEKLGHLFESLGSLLEEESATEEESVPEVNASAGFKDTVLLRCCRGFIPLEHLFRAYQPCELHLLIQALNWEESSLKDWGQAPISLGFATIAGRVETSDSESSQDAMTDFERWLVPYRSLFSALSADITLPVVRDLGSLEQQKDFVHQTMGLLDTVWGDPERDKLNFQSEFALWLARAQVTSVWGSLPINTTELINDNFPKWKDLNERQIVNKLVDMGLWGGIRRAARAPKDGDPNNSAWRLTYYVQDLRIDYVEETIYQLLCDSLSFSLPETDPPDWVTTTSFAMCFYHGLRQAVYHALETFVLIDNQQVGNEYLWVNWDNQCVSIYNRGKVNPKEHLKDFKSNDHGFFDRFLEKTDEFCRQEGIDEKFKINGPEPAADMDDIWQLVIRKEK